MNAQSALADAAPLSLESVELELSMSLQDLVAHGFEGALNRALELTGRRILPISRQAMARHCSASPRWRWAMAVTAACCW